MDGFLIGLWVVRLLFLGLLYLFLFQIVRALVRDLRAATQSATAELGRLHVLASPSGDPPIGVAFSLDNSIVIDDPFASTEHAVLTFRGRDWYVEDLGSTNGTYVNGNRVEGVAPLGYGDELQIGQVRLRLERARR
jgi:hypothetical protein